MAKEQAKEPQAKEQPKRKAPPPPQAAKKPAKEEKEGFRGIVRIAGKDVKGQVKLKRALTAVRGISHTLSVAASSVIEKELSIDPETPVGELSEESIEKVDKILFSLQDHGIPRFLMNRASDFSSGKDRHIIMNDLLFETNQDIDREKKAYSWKGFRHTFGQKVRGQRTRNTGRTGMAVGVLRKAIIAAQGGAAAGAKPGAPAAPAAAPAAGAKAPSAAAAAKPAAKPAEKK